MPVEKISPNRHPNCTCLCKKTHKLKNMKHFLKSQSSITISKSDQPYTKFRPRITLIFVYHSPEPPAFSELSPLVVRRVLFAVSNPLGGTVNPAHSDNQLCKINTHPTTSSNLHSTSYGGQKHLASTFTAIIYGGRSVESSACAAAVLLPCLGFA